MQTAVDILSVAVILLWVALWLLWSAGTDHRKGERVIYTALRARLCAVEDGLRDERKALTRVQEEFRETLDCEKHERLNLHAAVSLLDTAAAGRAELLGESVRVKLGEFNERLVEIETGPKVVAEKEESQSPRGWERQRARAEAGARA